MSLRLRKRKAKAEEKALVEGAPRTATEAIADGALVPKTADQVRRENQRKRSTRRLGGRPVA